jgi:hypothetical protein
MPTNTRVESLVYKTSRPKPMPQAPVRKIQTPAGIRLSTIVEDGNGAQQNSSSRNAFPKKLFPPQYPLRIGNIGAYDTGNSSDATSSTLDSEKRKTLAEHKQIARRGGWRRLGIVLVVILVIALALGLGLGLGLKAKADNSHRADTSSTSISPGSIPADTAQFPLGSYTFTTYLETVATDCASNPATWTCFPYTTFDSDPSKSLATFAWTITPSSSHGYDITSSQDPFSIQFSTVPLNLVDQGEDTERYTFQTPSPKQVSPSSAITGDNSASTCFYNSTVLQASLYTKMAKNSTDSDSKDSRSWPFAVQIMQLATGGTDVPNCYKTNEGVTGERITDGLAPKQPTDRCSCVYQNFLAPS